MVSAAGCGKDAFWDTVIRGESGIKRVRCFDTSEFKFHNAGEVTPFDLKDHTNRKYIKFIDRITRFTLAGSSLAAKDARLEINAQNSTRIGIVFGTMYSGWESLASFERAMAEDEMKKVSPMLFQNIAAHSPASQINLELGIKGLCSAIVNGFCSGSDSIGWACEYIQGGKADIILAGGGEELNRWIYGTFQVEKDHEPSAAQASEVCRPFDANRKGLVPGEGTCILVLERYETALKRNARIYAEVAGYGATNSAWSMGEYSTTGEGAGDAILLALEDGDTGPNEVDYICAEGNGTIPGDLYECRAIQRSYPESAQEIPISSIKPAIGHTFGASGAFNAAVCCLAIQKQIAPPTINCVTPDPLCDLNLITGKARELRVDVAISHSLSPGGNNSVLVFKSIK